MAEKAFVLDLAKLVIAAAWADGELCNEEVNALKDLLFNLDKVSSDDWTVLEMYMESPVTGTEQEELLEHVTKAIRNESEKALALDSLEQLLRCDGKVTPEEQALLNELKSEISGVSTSLFAGMSRALKSAIGQRRAAVRSSCLREHESDDYIRNTIHYDLKRRQKDSSVTIDRPEAEVRKLCLAAGLLSHAAALDENISNEEREAIRNILAEDWGLSEHEADLLATISGERATRGLDYFRLCQGFFECTDIDERRSFLKTLFRVANASNKTRNEEIEGLRRVARSLKLSHKDFIDAKLTISREDRKGL